MDDNRLQGAARLSMGRVQSDIGSLTGDRSLQIQGQVQQGIGHAQELYGHAKDAVRDGASEAADRAAALAEDVYDRGRRGLTQGVEVVEAQANADPLRTILIAAAVGYAAGVVLRAVTR